MKHPKYNLIWSYFTRFHTICGHIHRYNRDNARKKERMTYKISRKKAIFLGAAIVGAVSLWISTSNLSQSSKVKAYRVIINGNEWGYIADQRIIHGAIQQHIYEYSKIDQSGVLNPRLTLDSQIDVEVVVIDESQLSSPEQLQAKICEKEQEATYYTVQPGDSLWKIADEHDVALSEIYRLNPGLENRRIYSGTQVLVEPEDLLFDVIQTVEMTLAEPRSYQTQYIEDSSLLSGKRKVIKAGKNGLSNVSYSIETKNGLFIQSSVINEEVITEPIDAIVRIGTKKTLVRVSQYDFGVVKGVLTSGFGYRLDPFTGRKTFHYAIDVAAPTGTPVKAFGAGTIEKSTYSDSKGYYILINHGNGLKTEYAHLSKRLVLKGDTVNVGDRIGLVGNTGRSTGPHLHFSIIEYGKYVNPLSYL